MISKFFEIYSVKNIKVSTYCYSTMLCTKSNIARYCTSSAKELKDIPCAKGLPIIGTTLSLILAGSTPKLHKYIDKRHQQLGPIFKERIGPVECVFISDPQAIRLAFACEGKYPYHVLPEAWTTYNALHNVSRGLFFMNGQEWLHFRRILNPLLLKGDQSWLKDCCGPAIENLIGKIDNKYEIDSMLYHWSIEVIVSVLIGASNYAENKERLDKEIGYLASILHLIFETSSKLALIPSGFAAKYRIPRWKKFEVSVTMALKSTADLVSNLATNYENGEGLLGKLKEQMTMNEVVKIVIDLILAAGDTTAYSMEWLLYSVGRNLEVQKRLREEIRDYENKGLRLNSNSYLKNTIKESLRLYPVAPFLTRILPEPVTINGYKLSAGTVLIMSIFTTGRDKRNFNNPLVFDPDRWNRSEEVRTGVVHSAALPFAMGVRSCIGRKLAEAQLQLTLAKIVQNFDFKVTNKKEVDVILKMVAVPSRQIEFQFKRI
ncbi:unnamed protein product [Ceutorhynchus assimilis]|uniref:Uncharacterized protein n=1 Tax=Ceutorhynchus assimilis TaxID=467358 RepID=A0A9N9QFU5_9CUCU|nr:unnamed protein product [Ceutorhynchus assimilis]